MKERKVRIIVAGRIYDMFVNSEDEEILRAVGKNIEQMIKHFELNFDIKDKQDALAMCAIKLGTDAACQLRDEQKKLETIQKKIESFNQLLDE